MRLDLEFCPRCGSGPRQKADTVECPDCGYVWAGPRLRDMIAPEEKPLTVDEQRDIVQRLIANGLEQPS